jgi:hypothetical protein
LYAWPHLPPALLRSQWHGSVFRLILICSFFIFFIHKVGLIFNLIASLKVE